MTREEFINEMENMLGGYYVPMVFDEPNNRNNYCGGDMTIDIIDGLSGEGYTYEMGSVDDFSEIAAIMVENAASELAPASNVQDDNYMPMLRTLFGEDSKVIIAKKCDKTTYILVYDC